MPQQAIGGAGYYVLTMSRSPDVACQRRHFLLRAKFCFIYLFMIQETQLSQRDRARDASCH